MFPLFPRPKRFLQTHRSTLALFAGTGISIAYRHLVYPGDALSITLILPVDLPENALLARVRNVMPDRSDLGNPLPFTRVYIIWVIRWLFGMSWFARHRKGDIRSVVRAVGFAPMEYPCVERATNDDG